MAAIFTIRLPSGVSFEVKLPHGKPLAKEVKLAIKEARAIPVHDQRLILDGQELPDLSVVVETDKEISLIIDNTITETAVEYMRNCWNAVVGRDSMYHEDIPSAKELEEYALQCRERFVRAWAFTTETEEDRLLALKLLDVMAGRRSRDDVVHDFVTQCIEWALRCDRIPVTEESVQQYLADMREVAWAVEASRKRMEQISDPYDRDILDLKADELSCTALSDYRQRAWCNGLSIKDAYERSRRRDLLVLDPIEREVLERWRKVDELSCKAVVDYRERSWGQGLSVEDACQVSRQRDLLVLDPFERDVLDRWDRPGGVLQASRQYAAACGDGDSQDTMQGWVELLSPYEAPRSPEAPLKALAMDACTFPVQVGLIDVKHGVPGCAQNRKLCLSFGDWFAVPVVVVEPMHAKRSWRNQICEDLVRAGIPSFAFIPSAVAAYQIQPSFESMIIVDVGTDQLSVTPVYEGCLVVPAIVTWEREDLDSQDQEPGLDRIKTAIETALSRCPLHTTQRGVGTYDAAPYSRSVHLIGCRSSEALARQLQNESAGLSVKYDGADAAWRGAAKVCLHPCLRSLLTTKEEYLEHGCSAVHRKCL
ncbi:unnamed protein product [Symbiodinium sp. CCMP2592]|nr:unnamed protein product [Symbiodinium sp. CCMP2592]